MPTFSLPLYVQGTREQIRIEIISAFLKETPGTGRGENTTKYIYEVETTTAGEFVTLHRPAPLNKGMDFTVHASHTRFVSGRRRLTNPSHRNILDDLLIKQGENPQQIAIILSFIEKIYKCEDFDWSTIKMLNFTTGVDLELILKIIKWLFIEQDVTYWNWSGRHMLYSSIKNYLQN
ncbi:MAG: hypothetical protein FWG17_05620 [Desulfovibrionaceae bacterium]|nr:hypothetical protein [Desulfovibrionaceae bacterium]